MIHAQAKLEGMHGAGILGGERHSDLLASTLRPRGVSATHRSAHVCLDRCPSFSSPLSGLHYKLLTHQRMLQKSGMAFRAVSTVWLHSRASLRERLLPKDLEDRAVFLVCHTPAALPAFHKPVFVPNLRQNVRGFKVSMPAGFHVVFHFFGLPPTASLDELEAKGQRYCDTEWSAIAAKRGAEVHVEHYCFRSGPLLLSSNYRFCRSMLRGCDAWPNCHM